MQTRHSALGVVSFLVSVAAFAGSFSWFALAVIVSALHHGSGRHAHLGHVIFLLGLFALFVMDLIALGLGIAGATAAERKRLFAVLGIVFSSLQIAFMALLVLLHH